MSKQNDNLKELLTFIGGSVCVAALGLFLIGSVHAIVETWNLDVWRQSIEEEQFTVRSEADHRHYIDTARIDNLQLLVNRLEQPCPKPAATYMPYYGYDNGVLTIMPGK